VIRTIPPGADVPAPKRQPTLRARDGEHARELRELLDPSLRFVVWHWFRRSTIVLQPSCQEHVSTKANQAYGDEDWARCSRGARQPTGRRVGTYLLAEGYMNAKVEERRMDPKTRSRCFEV
jgi:hypothetical protein